MTQVGFTYLLRKHVNTVGTHATMGPYIFCSEPRPGSTLHAAALIQRDDRWRRTGVPFIPFRRCRVLDLNLTLRSRPRQASDPSEAANTNYLPPATQCNRPLANFRPKSFHPGRYLGGHRIYIFVQLGHRQKAVLFYDPCRLNSCLVVLETVLDG